MNRTIIKNARIGEEYIQVNHPTGLTVLLYPMKGYGSTFALFGTKYGSIDRSFKTNKEKEYVTVPDGIAHFLEHKLFENEEGDAFTLFAKTGASANAYTSFDRTCYLFSCTDNFEESLRNLMEFVQSPYFTEETIEKEQGIIGQEIDMVNDVPERAVYFNLLKALYKEHPVNIEIAGTHESIAQIDKDLLYYCYHTFYNLNNMALTIAGNFDAETALRIVDETAKQSEEITIEHKEFTESPEVNQKEITDSAEIAMPLFAIGYKLPTSTGMEELKAKVECRILNDIIIGDSSPLYRELYQSGLINASFGSEALTGLGYFANVYQGESRDPKKVYSAIQKTIDKLKSAGIDQMEFETAKKALYGSCVRRFNNVESVAENLISAHFSGVSIYNIVDVVAALQIEDVQKRLQSFDNEKSSISIVNPIE